MKALFFILLFCLRSNASDTVSLNNSWNVFSQKLGPEFSLPVSLSSRVPINIKFEIPVPNGPALKKVFSHVAEVNEFKAVFEVYFLYQNSQKYLSQQIYLFKAGELVTRCTSYFGMEQKFLVPGSCAGVSGGELFGIAIYK